MLNRPFDQRPVKIPLIVQRLRPRNGDLENYFSALFHRLINRLACEPRSLVYIHLGLAPHGVDLVSQFHSIKAFLQFSDAAQNQLLSVLLRQFVAIKKPPVREWARTLCLHTQDNIRADSHGAILQAADDLYRQVKRQPRRLAYKLSTRIDQTHVILTPVRLLDRGQIEHHRVLPFDDLAVLVPFHLYRLGSISDQTKLVQITKVDYRGIQATL